MIWPKSARVPKSAQNAQKCPIVPKSAQKCQRAKKYHRCVQSVQKCPGLPNLKNLKLFRDTLSITRQCLKCHAYNIASTPELT